MPLSSVVGAQSIVRPGVCTSSTRPASPYDGQVIYETDTDKIAVYDSSAWVYKTGATAPTDTSMASMIAPTSVAGTGVTLSGGKVSFTSASTVSVNGCFTAAYSNYRIVVNAKNGASADAIRIRFRAGGTDNSSGYYTHAIYTAHNGGPSRNYDANQAVGYIGWSADLSYNTIVDVHQPFAADYTSWMTSTNGIGSNSALAGNMWGFHYVTTSYDGFTIFPGTGSYTGNLRIYGYRESI